MTPVRAPVPRSSRRFSVSLLALSASLLQLVGCRVGDRPIPVETAILVAPPSVPPPIERRGPARVIVNLETNEQTWELADGVSYTF